MSDININAIDNKKKANTSDEKPQNYPAFIRELIMYVIYIFIIFVLIGSIGLFTCKIAGAKVLPDNVDYVPFGNKMKDINDIPININIIKVYGFMGLGMLLGQKPEKVESTKIVFDGKEILSGYKSGIFGFLNSLKTDPEKASYFGLYINNLISPIIATNNWIINSFFGMMNKYLPESIIILLYPFIIFFVILFMMFINVCLTFFYQIKNWSDFFMNKNIKNNTVSWDNPFTYFRPIRAFLFFLYCLFLFVPVISCLPFFTTFYSLLAPLGLKAYIYNTDNIINFSSFMKDVILYKSQLYLILFTYGLLTKSYSYLGSNGFIGCLVGVFIVFFLLHLYNPFIPTNNPNETPGLVSENKNITKNMNGGKNKKKGNCHV